MKFCYDILYKSISRDSFFLPGWSLALRTFTPSPNKPMNPPVIKVEIIHIEGSLKGTIQEFYNPVITIGRHPDCHVCFPKDDTAVSRHHAEIRREGNRFMAIDNSTNGTLVNGKPFKECFLKEGDVLTISENGPKISFLTTIMDGMEQPLEAQIPVTAPPETPASAPVPKPKPPVESQPVRNFYPEEPSAPPEPEPVPEARPTIPREPAQAPATPEFPVQTLQKPFIIQFGPMIKSFDRLPITIGSSPDADFPITHPSVSSLHVQVFLHDRTYHLKDLTGRNLVSVNGKPVGESGPMMPDTCIALSAQGPMFQFLGDGRLAEIDAGAPGQNVLSEQSAEPDAESGKQGRSFWPFGKK